MKQTEGEMRTKALAAFFSTFLSGQDPGVIGSTLATLMATFLVCHKRPDPIDASKLREDILAQWIATVRELVAADEREGETLQ